MRNGIAGIDHVIIGVRDLERARMGWTRLGFTLTPRGRHLGQGTANYCIMFPRDYLELLGFVTRDDYAHRLEA
ncbi:MAG: VOC family protein, partial [Alphaproteobacteria bacterium]